MESQYNLRSPAVKRLMKEAAELREPTELFFTQPLDDNLFEWHFSVRGPPDTEFEGGVYHGRIILPPEYPMKPPSIIILTPNGRFELNKKICLSISGYHPESWQPSWSIRTALLAIIGFMPTQGAGAIGSLEYPADERKLLAKRSLDWKCPTCGVKMRDVLPPLTEASKAVTEEAKELAQQISFKDERERKTTSTSSGNVSEISDESFANSPLERNAQIDHPATPQAPIVADNPGPTGGANPTTGSNPVQVQANRPIQEVRIFNHQAHGANVEAGSGAQLLMIVIVAIMIAALLFRRIWIMNDGQFPSRSDL